MMITDAEVLEALKAKHGQFKIVAELLGLANPQQLNWWHTRPSGIAWQWREPVYQLARKAGIKVPKEWLQAKPSGAAAKPKRKPARAVKPRPKPKAKTRPRRAQRNGFPATPRPTL